eukprot:CAMPEP_0171323742 /NCGR_PEP_ID=MMETSP0816-20121228/115763_1 /TAXON_ID=420281 /ORGANISM="Proboscia inermis, Strain CCAP1064/1" /LENGTH=126 /DNA_ID=CAMNT_0011822525 /DNA_START=1016 /DNA_END=1396 /DNA_ORIENTATION=-
MAPTLIVAKLMVLVIHLRPWRKLLLTETEMTKMMFCVLPSVIKSDVDTDCGDIVMVLVIHLRPWRKLLLKETEMMFCVLQSVIESDVERIIQSQGVLALNHKDPQKLHGWKHSGGGGVIGVKSPNN